MNFIQTIRSTLDRTLHIILDDEEILVTKLCNYDNKTWFSWSSWGPTEGSVPSYDSRPVTQSQILDRISLLSNEEPLTNELNFAINHFFGYNIDVNEKEG